MLTNNLNNVMTALNISLRSGLIIAFLSTMLVHTGSWASGSGSGGQWQAGDYYIGKRVFNKKLACGSCPLADVKLTRDSVQNLMPEISSQGELGQNLSFKEIQSVREFLRTKFNL